MSWLILLRNITNITKFYSASHEGVALTVNLLQEVELLILKKYQMQKLAQEILILLKENVYSVMYIVSLFEQKGFFCVGGCLKRSVLNELCIHSMLFPKESYITELIVRWFHESLAHSDREITLNELKEKDTE